MAASSTGVTVFGRCRLLRQALYPLRVKGMDDITDSLDRTAHQLRNGLRGQPPGTREDDLGTPDTEGVRCAPVGLQLDTLIIGQRSNKERWFHSPSIPRETPLHKNSCGDALDTTFPPPLEVAQHPAYPSRLTPEQTCSKSARWRSSGKASRTISTIHVLRTHRFLTCPTPSQPGIFILWGSCLSSLD